MKTAHSILLNSRLLFVASVLAFPVQPADAGLWDNIKESVTWSADDSSGASDEPTIPQVPVEYVGQVDLVLKGKVELAYDEDTPGIGNVGWMGFSPEGTLLLSDAVGRQAFEFSIADGQYIRSIGKYGPGPGEYGFPTNMAIDPQGYLYILDKGLGYLHRYDRQGQFLDRSPHFSKGARIVTGRDGAVYLARSVRTPSGYIIELQRLEPATSAKYEPIYRTPLSTNQPSFISQKMSGYTRLAYSPTRHQLYYMGTNDYKVTVIDPETGRLIHQFGYQLEKYRPLPERYYNFEVKTTEEISELDREMSSVLSMVLVQDQYIFVTYLHPSVFDDLANNALKWEGIVYDLKTPNQIKAYAFEEAIQSYPDPTDSSIVRFHRFIGNELTHWNGRLYSYQSPLPGREKDSNGTVVIYEPVFQLH